MAGGEGKRRQTGALQWDELVDHLILYRMHRIAPCSCRMVARRADQAELQTYTPKAVCSLTEASILKQGQLTAFQFSIRAASGIWQCFEGSCEWFASTPLYRYLTIVRVKQSLEVGPISGNLTGRTPPDKVQSGTDSMSGGVELVGVIASAAQLSSYVVRIAAQIQAVRAELREAPERIRQQDSHLLYLLSIIDSLRRSCIPCTKDIRSHLQRIQNNINNLRAVLEKNLKYLKKESIKKFWRAIHTIKAEERILSVLRSLEADKSNLILYLLGSCGETLQGIHQISKQQMEEWAKVGESFKKELKNMSDKPSVPSALSDSNKTMRDESLNSSGTSNLAQSDRRVTTGGSIQSQSEAQQASRSTVRNVLRNNPVVGVGTTSRLGVTFLPTGGNSVNVDNEIESSGAYGNFLSVEHAVTGEDRRRSSGTPVQHGVTEESNCTE